MKKIFLYCAVAAVSAVAFSSCEETPGGENWDNTPLTPEENRSKLEEIGLQAISMASADKQAKLLGVIDQFYKLANDYELVLADNYADDPSYRKITPKEPVYALMKSAEAFCKSGNPYLLSKAVIEESYIYEAGRVYGIYELKGGEWQYTESDEKLSFIFPCDGEEVVATISGSGEEYTYEHVDEWNDWEGNDRIDTYKITVPARIEASITSGSEELLYLGVNGEYNVGRNGHVNQTLDFTAGSYDIDMTVEVNSSNVSQSFTFDIDGTRLLSTNVSASGTNLTDAEYYFDNAQDMFSGAEAKVSVLDLNVNATCTNISKFIGDYIRIDDEAYEWEDNPYEWEPEGVIPTWYTEEYVTELSELVNSTFSVKASYGTDDPFADFLVKPMYSNDLWFYDQYRERDEYGNITNYGGDEHNISGYEPSFIIKFLNDGAEYEVVDFFNEKAYADVIDAAESLVDRYEYYLNYMFNY